MPHFGRWVRTGLLIAAAVLVTSCGRSKDEETALSAAPVRHVVALASLAGKWQPGKCLCVGHFREDTVEDFPAGLLREEFARHPWLRNWSACDAHYGRPKSFKGCEGGMTDFICSVSERSDLPSGITRVICHVNGQSEAMQREGYLQDEYNVTKGDDGEYVVLTVSSKASDKIHE